MKREMFNFKRDVATTEAEALEIARRDPGRWAYGIPRAFMTPEVCFEAVKSLPAVLTIMEEDLKTPELCEVAVRQRGTALAGVPERWRTPEICLLAVKNHGEALRHVPEALKTPELCLLAVQTDHAEREALFRDEHAPALQFVPEKLKTPEICMAAVQRRGQALECVPEKLKTPELCLDAVKRDGMMLDCVPMELRTAEICAEAAMAVGGPDEWSETAEQEAWAVAPDYLRDSWNPEDYDFWNEVPDEVRVAVEARLGTGAPQP